MDNINKSTLSEQIYTILKNDIINQKIKCGEKLTLKALQERFSLSSTPIREAMNRLSQEGLIDHVTNIGAKVVDLNSKDIIEIYDFCSILDVSALKLAIKNQKTVDLVLQLKESVRLQSENLSEENLKDFIYHSDNFHDILFKFADNLRLYNAAKTIRSQLSILTTKYQNFTIARSTVFLEHKEISQAVEDKEYDKAITLLTAHFEHARDYLLKNLSE